MVRYRLPLLVLALAFSLKTASALEYVRFMHNGKEQTEEGRVTLEERREFGFEARDGQFYTFVANLPESVRGKTNVISIEALITRSRDDAPFVPYTKAETLERLKAEFPAREGYHFLDIPPFIVIYTTSNAFANWHGNLLRRVHEQYVEHWKRLGVELTPPEFPLVVIMLSSDARYRQYAQQEGVNLFPEQRAYYHKLTNRIVMYDMSGQQAFREGNQQRINQNDRQNFLSNPNNIMTVVHEAVHLVGFNTGMHPRHTPNPHWLYEGLAVVHEVPDLRHPSGWSPGRPHVNRPRLDQLRRYLDRSPPELAIQRIQKMLQDDGLFTAQATALDNYALAWGVSYYLVRERDKEFAAYLKVLQEKTPLSKDNAEIRLKEFENAFGNDWNAFENGFRNFIRRQ